MTEKITIAVISHALVQDVFHNRWRLLADTGKFDVHLIVPQSWKSTWFTEDRYYHPNPVDEDNFHVHPLPTTSKSKWWRYLFVSSDIKFREIKPDLIYIIHEEGIWVHQQIYWARRRYAPDAKMIFFSMNGRGVPLKWPPQRWMWKRTKQFTDAALCHYPGCLKSLRDGGYDKPVFLQTQVGVNENLFRSDAQVRESKRKELGFDDKFVIGFVGRLTPDKGVDDLIAAVPSDRNDWALLLVGNGPMRPEVESRARREGWHDRLYITNQVPQEDVPALMNAMDLLCLGSKTTPHWIDTFPLVTVQAQACGVPVLASDSASLPWQLGDTAIFFPEGDRTILKQELVSLMDDEARRLDLAKRGRERSLEYFCHEKMTENFCRIVDQVMSDDYEFHAPGESYTQWKAY